MLSWRDIFSVGEPEIDREHKEILDFINLLDEISYDKKINYKIVEMLEDFKDKMIAHFNYEEVYMEKIEFPKLERHMEEHQLMLEEIDRLKHSFELINNENEFNLAVNEIKFFSRDHLIMHLMGDDKEYHIWSLSKKTFD